MRNYALTIAGFDPSGGAGLTADIKTFEQHKVYGLAVCTAITLQTEDEFLDIRWESQSSVLRAVEVLLTRYPVKFVKTGILPSVEFLEQIVHFITLKFKHVSVIVDPVFSSSTGNDFISGFNRELFYSILKNCYLITPNTSESILISGKSNEYEAAAEIANHCQVLLKGGHSLLNPGTDFLFEGDKVTEFRSAAAIAGGKHGSGCILSAAITASLTAGMSLQNACRSAKAYTEKTLTSNASLLAFHHVS